MRLLFTALACLLSVNVFGQVVYTDLIPDIIVDVAGGVDEIDTYELDFNSDGVFDISIYMMHNEDFQGAGLPVTMGAINTASTNEVVGMDTTLLDLVDLLFIEKLHQYVEIINASLNYVSSSTSFIFQDPILIVGGLVPEVSMGNFQENIDGYFGVKFDIDGNSHYGWVRIVGDIVFTNGGAAGASLEIKDFAYEATPNMGIIVGDDGSGIMPGCIIEIACNYNANATDSDNSCLFVGDPCDDGLNATVNDSYQADCSCEGAQIVYGCTYESACNYHPEAIENDGSCLFVGDPCDDDDETTNNDIYQEDCICSGYSTSLYGCTYSIACNYNSVAQFDDDSCIFIGDSCNDKDPNTLDDEIQEDCECAGTPNTIVDELDAFLVFIYPNPASNNLTIELGDLTGLNTTIKLYDSSSKLVFEKQSTSTLLIDVSVYAKGLYTLELSTDDRVLRSQVVIE